MLCIIALNIAFHQLQRDIGNMFSSNQLLFIFIVYVYTLKSAFLQIEAQPYQLGN